MPLLHLSLPPHRLLVAGRGRLLFPPAPRHARLSFRAAAGDAAVSVASEVYGLPFPPERASHHRELAAATATVERACRLCVDVKRSLFSGAKSILEKNDQTPVTIADFGVQALISLGNPQHNFEVQFCEEDSASLRSSKADDNSSDVLVESIFSAVADKVSNSGSPLTQDDVLRAIDRGGKDAVSFDSNPATYWVLDPIDGTKGFLRGDDALYVVGLALVVNGKVTVGVMGCPNWTNDAIANEKDDSAAACNGHGILMLSHIGCGTWSRSLSAEISGQFTTARDIWKRCFVDTCSVVHMARYCIPDSQTWDMIPLSVLFNSTTDESDPRNENEILLLSVFCGSLCKYLTVASGGASVFVLRARPTTQIKVPCLLAISLVLHDKLNNLLTWLTGALITFSFHTVYIVLGSCCWGNLRAGSWRSGLDLPCLLRQDYISDWSGKPLDLAADLTSRRIIYPSGGVLVTNGALHDRLVEMISANYM
ncbi:putative PAP-specific phosphatase, mitochondrial [Dichanthelium oligosanthes]|uniref:Putative PAP-specific phosphatase, mitochondrial n=1 Tax=Dichanthelium oligosanthes TaxID=888268 RepID=A0A1E5WDJ8_9POAL|nr:putative PAP-specific phosphatase, mitochondrial [Dichanthelium oligosanthes]